MKNNEIVKIEGTDEAWDSGELGNSAEFVRRASKETESEIDDALGLQMISLRLSRELLKELKTIAQFSGVGYQPLMRDVLTRFATGELKRIAIEYANQRAEKEKDKAQKGISRASTTTDQTIGKKAA